jgi:hypothetical protein
MKRLVYAAMCVLACAGLAAAAQMWQTRASAEVVTFVVDPSVGTVRVNNCYQDNTGTPSALANCEPTLFTLSGNEIGSGSGWGAADLGVLHAFGSASVGGTGVATPVSAGADAVFIDSITVGSPDCSPCGFTGYLRASGSLAGRIGGDAVADFAFGFSIPYGPSASCELNTSIPSNPQGCSTQLAVTEGETVTFAGSLGVSVYLEAGNGLQTGIADFADTAWISGLELLDANHNPVSNSFLTIASGTDYNALGDGTAAPEPGSFGLWAAGGVLVVASRLRQNTRGLDADPRGSAPGGARSVRGG